MRSDFKQQVGDEAAGDDRVAGRRLRDAPSAPRTPTEAKLAAIWGELLALPAIVGEPHEDEDAEVVIGCSQA